MKKNKIDRIEYKKKVKENKKYIKNKTINKDFPKTSQLPNGIVVQAQDAWKIVVIDDKRFDIVKGVNLDIYFGDFLMIFGESGSGKTSLISLLSALERPSEGNINIYGQNTCTMTNNKLTELRAKYVGYIFQQYGLLKDITVLENILITCSNEEQKKIFHLNKKYIASEKEYMNQIKKIFKQIKNNAYKMQNYEWFNITWFTFNIPISYYSINGDISLCYHHESYSRMFWNYIRKELSIIRDEIFGDEYVYKIIKWLEIDHLINEKIMKLSGGQQQRVSIARAISKKPKLLFADEPTGAVDTLTAKAIMKLFIKLNTDFHTTIIMVSHNKNLTPLSNRIITIENGQIIADVINDNRLSIEEIDFE